MAVQCPPPLASSRQAPATREARRARAGPAEGSVPSAAPLRPAHQRDVVPGLRCGTNRPVARPNVCVSVCVPSRIEGNQRKKLTRVPCDRTAQPVGENQRRGSGRWSPGSTGGQRGVGAGGGGLKVPSHWRGT